MKKLLILLFWPVAMLAQNPPVILYTNTFKIEIRYATDGVHFTNSHGASTVVNVSSNSPWANGYGANPPGSPWAWVTGYPTNLVVLNWTWGDGTEKLSTNFLMATNDPNTTLGTLLTFYVYPPGGEGYTRDYITFFVPGINSELRKWTGSAWAGLGTDKYTVEFPDDAGAVPNVLWVDGWNQLGDPRASTVYVTNQVFWYTNGFATLIKQTVTP